MSNPLSVRRVMVQTLDAAGNPINPPSYGVVASDNHATAFTDEFDSRDELEAAIDHAGCILAVADPGFFNFADADPNKIGQDNFYGTDWMTQPVAFTAVDPAESTDAQPEDDDEDN